MVQGHFFAKVSEFVTDDGRWAFQSPPGQMAAFVSLLETQAKDAGTAINDYKQVDMRSHSMIVAIRHNFGPGGDCARDLWI